MNLSLKNPTRFSSPIARLQELARPREKQEHCELCGSVIPPEHQHLLELATRQLACSCEACAILFSDSHALRYRRIPRRIQLLDNFQLTDELWDGLHIPINLAFFYHDSNAHKLIAMYPSPAGATESLIPLDAWTDLVAANPILEKMQPDVEALLIDRVGTRRDLLIVPIDQCYKLVGLIRTHWRGLSGGNDVWREIAHFFEHLRRQGSPAGGTAHA
jgi:hypothetical protein